MTSLHNRLVALTAIGLIVCVCAVRPLRAGDGTTKIATANAAKIFNEMQETKDLKQKMENERKTLEATDKEKKDKINQLREGRDQLRPDAPQFQEQNQSYLKAQIDYKVWAEIQQQELGRAQKQQMKSLFDKITAAVTEVAKQKGIDLVIAEMRPDLPENLEQINVDQLRLLINQRDVLFANENVDISNDVIAVLDTKYKSGGK
jgi:Skp family chaperone for outer membrane proteins